MSYKIPILSFGNGRDEFEPGTNFKAWACSVARYRSLEHRKKMNKDSQLVFSDDLLLQISNKIQEKDMIEQERIHQALESCMEKLSEQNKNLIKARYSDHQSLEDLALQDGRTYASVRVILNRLRQQLRNCIDLTLTESTTP